MTLRVVFLESAKHDLRDLRYYLIKNFGMRSWQISYRKIKETINTIQEFPLEGRIPDELESVNLTQYRQLLSGMNRIIYETRQQTIYIHIICDARRDMRSLLTRRLMRAM